MYGVSTEDFQFSFAVGPSWEIDPESLSFKLNISTLCVPQLGSQYMLNCVAPSGAFVVAGDLSEPFVQATLPITSAASRALAEMRGVVRAIRESQTIPTSSTLDQLLTRAVQSRGTPKDVKAWANGLAGDISELVD